MEETEKKEAAPEVQTEVENKDTEVKEPQTKQKEPTQENSEKKEKPLPEVVEISENEKAYSAALRKLLEIPENEEIGSIDERISAYEKSVEAKLAAARDQVISAELKALSGYDTKLLDRLIDRSKLTVDKNGKVNGIEEAVKAIATEFPAVKLKTEHKPFTSVNPAGADFEDKKMTLSEAMEYANKHPGTDVRTLI